METKQVRVTVEVWRQLRIYALWRGLEMQDAASILLNKAMEEERPEIAELEIRVGEADQKGTAAI